MKALLVGLGAVGARSARQLLSSKAVSDLVVFSRNPAKAGARLAALGGGGALTLEPLTAPAFSEALAGAASYSPYHARAMPMGGRGQSGRRSASGVDLRRPS